MTVESSGLSRLVEACAAKCRIAKRSGPAAKYARGVAAAPSCLVTRAGAKCVAMRVSSSPAKWSTGKRGSVATAFPTRSTDAEPARTGPAFARQLQRCQRRCDREGDVLQPVMPPRARNRQRFEVHRVQGAVRNEDNRPAARQKRLDGAKRLRQTASSPGVVAIASGSAARSTIRRW